MYLFKLYTGSKETYRFCILSFSLEGLTNDTIDNGNLNLLKKLTHELKKLLVLLNLLTLSIVLEFESKFNRMC